MFKPISTQKISDNLYAVRSIMVNFYIYDTGNGLVVFDTGISAGLARLGFKKLNLDYNKVTHVFLTHSDFDHVGGLKLFKNASIYISKKEEPLITFKKSRRLLIYNRKIKDCTLLDDSQIVDVDNTSVKLISTPGHTIGSAMYIINDNTLIGGDTISISHNHISNFSFVQNMKHSQNVETVNKLKNEKFFDKMSLIATGHHGILRL